MKLKNIISTILTLVLLVGSLTLVVSADWADKVDENEDPLINYITQVYMSPDEKLQDMIMVRELYGYQLWFEEFTGEVAVVDTATGEAFFSNPYDIAWQDQSVSKQTKQKLLSQLIITYLDNGQSKTMLSYVEAALRGQIKLKYIKNGMRVEYTLGEENVTRLVPRMITVDRFEEMIIKNYLESDDPNADWDLEKLKSFYTKYDKDDPTLTARQIAEFQAKYPITIDLAVYVCTPEIKSKELRTLEEKIKEYCPLYTYEELEYDHEITKYTGTDAAPPRFRMSLEYTLSENGLEVRLPANGIEFDESVYQFQTVSILPYFGAGNNKYTGYTFIPDGSGSLIRFEDYKDVSINVSGQLYGPDYAYHEITGQHSEQMTMPCFGVVTNYGDLAFPPDPDDTDVVYWYPEIDYSNGFLAVITEGDSLASLMAECGGLLHPYNTVYASFTPRPSDEYNLGDSISVSGNATWTVTSSRKYTGSYRIQYIFLRDKDIAEERGIEDSYEPTWVGMATAYRDFLTKDGVLTKLENTKENLPLFIESFGSVTAIERVASFPVTVDKPLTTFEDIKTMYSELRESDKELDNISFRLTGFANGGLQPTVPSKLKWVDVLGGNGGFEDLVEYANEEGFDIYPDFDFAYIHDDGVMDGVTLKKDAVRTIDNRYTTKRYYDAAIQKYTTSFAVALSPASYEHLYDNFSKNYSKYNNNSISVATLGTDLNSDFDDDEPYHREDDKEFTVELLARMSDDYDNVLIDGGNSYAVKYADVILNAALTSSKYNKTSESVPFLGMVYHGSKVLAGTATNMEGDINEAILNAIENGATMYFVLSYQNTNLLKENPSMSKYYSVAYDIWKDDVVTYYKRLNEQTNDLQESYIVDHEFLDAVRIQDEDEAVAAENLREELWQQALQEAETKLFKKRRSERLYARLDGLEYESMTLDVPQDEIEELAQDIFESYTTEETIAAEKARYATVRGTVVRVEYEGDVNFILNYNSFDVTVEYDGVSYDIPALGFQRID